jgi:hypothetical protein
LLEQVLAPPTWKDIVHAALDW